MNWNIDLSQADIEQLVPKEEPKEGKRWSYSFVFFLEDLRNIYRLYEEYDLHSIPELYNKCKEVNLESRTKKAWTQRNLLEIVNALKNFKLLSVDDEVVQRGLFSNSLPSEELTHEEKKVFKEIYYDYFRFKEFHRLFLEKENVSDKEDIEEWQSRVIFYYTGEGRFTNHFIIKTKPSLQILEIPNEHSDMMRFWDVFLKWGTALNLMNKNPLKPFGVTTTPSTKGLGFAYFTREMPKDFSVFEYVRHNMEGSYLYIPDIIYSLVVNMRFAVKDIKARLEEESQNKANMYRAQSTSAIFLDPKEDSLIPKIGNTYFSHLLKL